LTRCFSEFGAIKNIRVNRQDAIITFENPASANKSLTKSGILLKGERLEVTLAATPPQPSNTNGSQERGYRNQNNQNVPRGLPGQQYNNRNNYNQQSNG